VMGNYAGILLIFLAAMCIVELALIEKCCERRFLEIRQCLQN